MSRIASKTEAEAVAFVVCEGIGLSAGSSVDYSRPDLFAVARNDRALKLHMRAVQKILDDGIEAAMAQPEPVPQTKSLPKAAFAADILRRRRS
jgi:hypothetical protein